MSVAGSVASFHGCREIVRNGENGLLAATQEEWLMALRELIDLSALRRRLGEAGRATVEERYSARTCSASFGRLIHEVVDNKVV